MTRWIKIYIAVAALLAIALIVGAVTSHIRLARLERDVGTTRQRADEAQQRASAKESQAAEYTKRIDYLETQVASLEETRRQQDEKQKVLTTRTRDARADVTRTRGTRTNETAITELCDKLKNLGHECN